jgi:hypothetical protein
MAYGYDFASGASSGLSTGMTTALMGAGPWGWAATGASALLGGLTKKSKTEIPWGKVVTMPQYDFTEGRLKTSSDFVNNSIDALGRGEEMPWWSQYKNTIQDNMHDSLNKQYQGWGSQKGLYDIAAQTGAVSGLGPKATNAQVSKQMLDYQQRAKDIDTEIAKISAEVQSSAATSFPQISSNMPRGPEAQIVGGGSGGYQPVPVQNYGAGISDTLGQLAQYSNINWSNPWGGGSGDGQMYDMNQLGYSTTPAGYQPWTKYPSTFQSYGSSPSTAGGYGMNATMWNQQPATWQQPSTQQYRNPWLE